MSHFRTDTEREIKHYNEWRRLRGVRSVARGIQTDKTIIIFNIRQSGYINLLYFEVKNKTAMDRLLQ